MEVTTLRVPADLLEELKQEADERDVNLSEYLRDVLQARDTASIDGDDSDDLEELRTRVERLERELGVSDDDGGGNDRRETPTPDDRADGSALDATDPADDETVTTDATDVPGDGDDLPPIVERAIDQADIVGRGAETKEVRRNAIRYAWRELQNRGEATTQELANATFDEFEDTPRFGYSASTTHYRGYTFWDSFARDVLKDLPGIQSPPERGNTWRFVGTDESTENDENTRAEGHSPRSKGGGNGSKSGVYDPTDEFE